MFRILKTEIWKAFHNAGFYTALMAGIGISLVDILLNWIKVKNHVFTAGTMTLSNGVEWSTANVAGTSVYYNWLGVNSLNLTNVIFYFLFPLLAAMPYGWSALTERKSKYRSQLLVRTGKRKAIVSKYCASALAGGITVTAPLIANFVLGVLVMPLTKPRITDMASAMTETQFGSLIFYRHPFLFVIADIGLVFLWGCGIGAAALALGQFFRHMFEAVISPFVICFLVELIFEVIPGITKTEWSPIRLFHMDTIRGTSGFVIFGEILMILLISFFVFYVRGLHDEGL